MCSTRAFHYLGVACETSQLFYPVRIHNESETFTKPVSPMKPKRYSLPGTLERLKRDTGGRASTSSIFCVAVGPKRRLVAQHGEIRRRESLLIRM